VCGDVPAFRRVAAYAPDPRSPAVPIFGTPVDTCPGLRADREIPEHEYAPAIATGFETSIDPARRVVCVPEPHCAAIATAPAAQTRRAVSVIPEDDWAGRLGAVALEPGLRSLAVVVPAASNRAC
jgi:hypothetical protein